MSKKVIIRQNDETLLASSDAEVLTFDLDDMDDYDWYEQSVRVVLDELANELSGPATARLLYVFSKTFLEAHGERLQLSAGDLP